MSASAKKSLANPYVLIAEDEEDVSELIKFNLEAKGFRTAQAFNGDDVMMMIAENPPDLLILDWMLPDLSGIEICQRIRTKTKTQNLPIIMLTARGEERDRVRGLEVGADDYITKPFSINEFVARVHAVLRRIRPGLAEDRLIVGDIEVDRASHRVKRGGKALHLGPTEYRLLECMMQYPDRVFTREHLLDAAWGTDVYVEARTVDVHIGRLRRAIQLEGRADPIRTIRSAGYALQAIKE